MKKLFLFFSLLLSLYSISQSTLQFRADSMKFFKQGGKASLIVDSNAFIKSYLQVGGYTPSWNTYKGSKIFVDNSYQPQTFNDNFFAFQSLNGRIRIDNREISRRTGGFGPDLKIQSRRSDGDGLWSYPIWMEVDGGNVVHVTHDSVDAGFNYAFYYRVPDHFGSTIDIWGNDFSVPGDRNFLMWAHGLHAVPSLLGTGDFHYWYADMSNNGTFATMEKDGIPFISWWVRNNRWQVLHGQFPWGFTAHPTWQNFGTVIEEGLLLSDSLVTLGGMSFRGVTTVGGAGDSILVKTAGTGEVKLLSQSGLGSNISNSDLVSDADHTWNMAGFTTFINNIPTDPNVLTLQEPLLKLGSDNGVYPITPAELAPSVSSVDTSLWKPVVSNGGRFGRFSYWPSGGAGGSSDHTTLTNLTTGDAGHTQFALLAGRAGGQVLKGGTAAGDVLNLRSTSGTGTSTVAGVVISVGTDGGTTAIQAYNSGIVGVGNPNYDANYGLIVRQPSDAANNRGIKISANNQTAHMFIGYQKISYSGQLQLEGNGGVQLMGTGGSVFQNMSSTGLFFFGGSTTPTAIGDFSASTTARSSLRIRDGAAPTTPNDGDVWKATYAKIYQNSAIRRFVTTNDATPSNGSIIYGNGAEYSILSPGTDGQILQLASSVPAWVDNTGLTNSTVTTTDATPANIVTYTPALGEMGSIEITLNAVRNNGDEYVFGKKIVNYFNTSGGTLSIISIIDINPTAETISTGTPTWTATTSGSNIIVPLTGVAATNIIWKTKHFVNKSNAPL